MRNLAVAAVISLAAFSTSCKKPVPPQIVVEGAKVTRVGLNGIEVTVHVAATNPNSFDLTFRNVTANVVLAGKYPLGQAALVNPVPLPAGQTVKVDVPMISGWPDMTTLGMLAASNQAIPYTVNGTFAVGGETVNVTVPFTAQGTITHDLLIAAAVESTGIPLLKK